MTLLWEETQLTLVVLAILSLASEVTPAPDYLPGSCTTAGYTDCCLMSEGEICLGGSDPQGGGIASCLCDVSCYQHDDCCSDIAQICTPVLEPDAMLPAQPSSLLANNVTFHSATIQWATSSDTSINGTYTVKYYPAHTDTDASNGTTVLLENSTAHIRDGKYFFLLTGLYSGMKYYFTVSARNEFGSRESEEETFATLHYPAIRLIKTEFLNATAILISWSGMSLPLGVKISHYTVYYHILPFNDGRSRTQTFPAYTTYGAIGGLASHTSYQFQVSGTIVEVDGSIFEGKRSTLSADATVFVPEIALVQLRGGPFQPCSEWNNTLERETTTLFRSAILQAIRRHCDCEYLSSYIGNEAVLCTDEAPAWALYRADIASTRNNEIGEILEIVKEWISTRPVNTTLSSAGITLDQHCPVEIDLWSDPPCLGQTITCDCRTLPPPPEDESSSTSENCVSLGIFAVALAVEMLLMLVILLIGIVVTLIVSRKRGKSSVLQVQMMNISSDSSGQRVSRPASNIYTSQNQTGMNTS